MELSDTIIGTQPEDILHYAWDVDIWPIGMAPERREMERDIPWIIDVREGPHLKESRSDYAGWINKDRDISQIPLSVLIRRNT